MKSSELKKLIKEAVREAIQEELKEVLLEAVRAPKITNTAAPSQVLEAVTSEQPPFSNTPQQREAYANILGGMESGLTTNQVPPKFNPTGGLPGGDLPPGEVDMSQIMSIMGK